MTDDRSLAIERFFDGELAEDHYQRVLDRLAEDPEVRRHLDRLELLRGLAIRHNSALAQPRGRITPSRFRSRSRGWVSIVATAAAIALICWPRWRDAHPPRNGLGKQAGIASVLRSLPPVDRSSLSFDRPPLEVELYGWANTPSRASGQAARLVLSPASPARKRSSADEILALELANASPKAQGNVRRFAVSRGSKITSSSRLPTPNPRSRAI